LRLLALFSSFLLVLGLVLLAPEPPSPGTPKPVPDAAALARAEAERALRTMENRLNTAVASKDRQAFLALWADDAAIFPPGKPVVVGKENILREWAPILKDPDVSLTWQPDKVEASASGDLGYTYGKFRWRGKDPEGRVQVHNGKYVTIWRKGKDGRWRAVVDLGTPSDPPPEPPTQEN